jgi:hypothetical protein
MDATLSPLQIESDRIAADGNGLMGRDPRGRKALKLDPISILTLIVTIFRLIQCVWNADLATARKRKRLHRAAVWTLAVPRFGLFRAKFAVAALYARLDGMTEDEWIAARTDGMRRARAA